MPQPGTCHPPDTPSSLRGASASLCTEQLQTNDGPGLTVQKEETMAAASFGSREGQETASENQVWNQVWKHRPGL